MGITEDVCGDAAFLASPEEKGQGRRRRKTDPFQIDGLGKIRKCEVDDSNNSDNLIKV